MFPSLEEEEELEKKIRILKVKAKAELKALDKLIDLEDPKEIRESMNRLGKLVVDHNGLIHLLEQLEELRKKLTEG